MLCTIIVLLILVDQLDVIAHDLQLGDAGIVLCLLSGLRERVAHDGDQHVQEHDHDQEACQQEQDVAHRSLVVTFHVGICVELTQAELVHIFKRVKDPQPTDIRHQTIVGSVHINDVEGRAEGHVPDAHDNHEVLYAKDRVDHQADEEGCTVKEAQPVEHLKPQEER